MQESQIKKFVDGSTWLSRLLLALTALTVTWILFCAYLLLLKSTEQPMLQTVWLAHQSARVAFESFILFVALVVLPSKRVQLRFAYILVVLSLAWSIVIFRLEFTEWPWMVFYESPVVSIMVWWFGGFTLCAVMIYLLFLKLSGK
jgi:hypothetical protein